MTELTELLKQVKNLDIKTKNLVEGMESGAYRSRFRGGGIEFSDVREYAAGDDAGFPPGNTVPLLPRSLLLPGAPPQNLLKTWF